MRHSTRSVALGLLGFAFFASVYLLNSTLRKSGEVALSYVASLYSPSIPQHAPVGQGWVLFGTTGNDSVAYFIRLTSIERFSDRAAGLVRHVVDDPSKPLYNGQILPEADYMEDLLVFSCDTPFFALSETNIFSKRGSLLYNYKWGEPEALDLSIGTSISHGAVVENAQKIACNPKLATPFLKPSDFAEINFTFLSRSLTADGDIYYATNPTDITKQLFWYKYDSDLDLAKTFSGLLNGLMVSGTFTKARSTLQSIDIDCVGKQFISSKEDYYDNSNNLIDIQLLDEASPVKITESSPLSVLLHKQCGPSSKAHK